MAISEVNAGENPGMVRTTPTAAEPRAAVDPFKDIAPYPYDEFRSRMARLADEEGFEHAVRYVMPEVDYAAFRNVLLAAPDVHTFQRRIVGQFLEHLASKTTAGVAYSGMENVKAGECYTFLSNHRDIVLDSAFLNLCFIRAGKPITQIAIGNNLLIYEWIRDLVRINRSFIVKRDVKKLEALAAARQLSAYIHHTIAESRESVWIAQREGRAKDSNDVTQESLLKMFTLAGSADPRQSLVELNILPVSISYEFDPNDYLKATEFLMRRRDPEFKKSSRDDLFSMETGILEFKGRVHFTINRAVAPQLRAAGADGAAPGDRNSVVRQAREIIDRELHRGYEIYPINYIAYDRLNQTERFADRYDVGQERTVDEYLERQEARISVPDITDDERAFVRRMFLVMYANPLINKLRAESCEGE